MSIDSIHSYLPEPIRAQIEQGYYARVNAQGRFEEVLKDPAFWKPGASRPVALFSDHGVVHVRDVAQLILQVLKAINGVLIDRRSPERMETFMNGYGVIVAYLHDIGMSDLSPFGRAMHPEFAAQAVFTPALETVVDAMWEQNCGQVAARISHLAQNGFSPRPAKDIFRELISLSVAHSKSKTPIKVLDDPRKLREHMVTILRHNLRDLYRKQLAAKGKTIDPDFAVDETPPAYLAQHYTDVENQAYDWLLTETPEGRELVHDVIDTLRALRFADAFRQRGTVQKTSGGYEVFVSQQTGNAVYALRLSDQKLYLLELPDPLPAGEANIASCEISTGGNLRISFHRGAYATDEAQGRAVYSTAFTITDILADIVDSFWRGPETPTHDLKTSAEIQILLESTDDNPRFVELVQAQLRHFNPKLSKQIHIVPSLQTASEPERNRYLEARDVNWDHEMRQTLLENVKFSGQRIEDFDLDSGFRHTKLTTLSAGEKLIEAGAPSAFVYIPLNDGLQIIPLGGYQPFSVTAWMPVGSTGVIRGDIRNADVIAGQDVSLLIIPKDVYLRHWYAPYSYEELKTLFAAQREK